MKRIRFSKYRRFLQISILISLVLYFLSVVSFAFETAIKSSQDWTIRTLNILLQIGLITLGTFVIIITFPDFRRFLFRMLNIEEQEEIEREVKEEKESRE